MLIDEDELIHAIMHAAQQQLSGTNWHVNANIASYDPRTHRVRCIIPHYVDGSGGEALLTGWLPLQTPIIGNGWGMQYAPFGGATPDSPQSGEPVVLAVVEQHRGIYTVEAMFWGTNAAVAFPGLQAGELIIKDSKGSIIYWQSNGDITISAAQDVLIDCANNLTATVGNAASIDCASLTATVSGAADLTAATASVTASQITLGASGQTLQELVTAAAISVFNTHTHPDPQGGTTGAPNQQMGSGQLTSTVTAG